MACGHLTQWAVGTVGWLTAVRGLGGVIDVGTFASVTAPTRCRETPSPRRPLVTAIGRHAARLAYLSAHPPIRVNLIPSLVARVRRASGCLLFRFRESTSHHRACVLVSDRRLHMSLSQSRVTVTLSLSLPRHLLSLVEFSNRWEQKNWFKNLQV